MAALGMCLNPKLMFLGTPAFLFSHPYTTFTSGGVGGGGTNYPCVQQAFPTFFGVGCGGAWPPTSPPAVTAISPIGCTEIHQTHLFRHNFLQNLPISISYLLKQKIDEGIL